MANILITLFVCILILTVLIVVFSLIFGYLGERKFRISFLCGHSMFLILVLALCLVYRDEAQWQFFWFLPTIVDLPISILVMLFNRIFHVSNVFITFILFMIFGNIQYYVYGWGIDVLLKKLPK